MRVLMFVTVLLAACSVADSSVGNPISSPSTTSSPAPKAAATPAGGCEPTRSQDATGVMTSDGRIGIVGETFALGDLLNGGTNVVRRAAITGDRVNVRFDQIGGTAPATWVAYGVTATPLATPWGDAVFKIGWKPIAFEDSCWRLIVDGADTGIVLAIGH
jgi:hypothetical protein